MEKQPSTLEVKIPITSNYAIKGLALLLYVWLRKLRVVTIILAANDVAKRLEGSVSELRVKCNAFATIRTRKVKNSKFATVYVVTYRVSQVKNTYTLSSTSNRNCLKFSK